MIQKYWLLISKSWFLLSSTLYSMHFYSFSSDICWYSVCQLNLMSLESPLDWKEIQPVHPKGNQSWIFIERIDAEAEAPILWPPDAKVSEEPAHWKRPWCWESLKAEGEGDYRRWHHQLNGHDFEQAPEDGDGQGSMAFCSPWGHKESDTTERLKWTVNGQWGSG